MRHEFDAALRADPERLALAERAAAALDEELLYTPEILAEVARWRLPGAATPPPDPNAYDLRLHEPTLVEFVIEDDIGSAATGRLRAWERDRPEWLRSRLRETWREVLAARSRRHFREWIDSQDAAPAGAV